MNTTDVLEFAKKAIPWIGAAATGNVPVLIGMAAKAVEDVLGVKVDATPSAVATAIANATPAELLMLKQADNEFAMKMREFDYKEASELVAGAYADTASARNRDVALVTVTGKTNKRADIMLGLTYLGLVALVACMLIRDIDANSALGGIVILLIGKLISQWETGFQFEFGTNRASKTKDDTIKSLTSG